MSKIPLGDRMKRYEVVAKHKLVRRIPVIVRVDGKAFHTFTRKHYGKGYTPLFQDQLTAATLKVVKGMQNCTFAYRQSDEISFLLTDYRTLETDPWFDNTQNKIETISASTMSAEFTNICGHVAVFDARAFNLPPEEVCNYFIWRQQDAIRNAIQTAGLEQFSQKQLHGVSAKNIVKKLTIEKQVTFSDFSLARQRGVCIEDSTINREIPVFSEDRDFVEKYVYFE